MNRRTGAVDSLTTISRDHRHWWIAWIFNLRNIHQKISILYCVCNATLPYFRHCPQRRHNGWEYFSRCVDRRCVKCGETTDICLYSKNVPLKFSTPSFLFSTLLSRICRSTPQHSTHTHASLLFSIFYSLFCFYFHTLFCIMFICFFSFLFLFISSSVRSFFHLSAAYYALASLALYMCLQWSAFLTQCWC